MTSWFEVEPPEWWRTVEDALAEDVGPGDATAVVIPADLSARWWIEAQAPGILCGTGIVEYLLAGSPPDAIESEVEILVGDGEKVSRGDRIAQGRGMARRVLSVERTALNFLMFLSGVATLTQEYVQRVAGTSVRIVDTRKTVPTMRSLQKYAVRCGGGFNHRMGLFDAGMLKDNHICVAGSISEAVALFRSRAGHMLKLEVECETIDQVANAVAAGADVIMLDNMDPFEMRQVVKEFQGRCMFEASGGVTLDTVRQVANTGVDLISVGALTHSAPSLPFHMEFD